MARLVGRISEQKTLRRAMESPDSEFIAVYGRRRVGKTFLVREHFGSDVCFEMTGACGARLGEQLQNFASALEEAGESSVAVPDAWRAGFQQLIAFLKTLKSRKRKRVVFFDEVPWLASRRSGFLSAFEHFWNAWAVKQSWLIVVICGSSASWMIQKVLRSRGGLHNRVTRRIRLLPFTLAESRDFLESRSIRMSEQQIIELYMAFGGIVHYLKEVERGESAAQNIERVCFARDGILRDEFDNLYASLFEKSDRHIRVVRALAKRRQGLTRQSVIEQAGLQTGGATSVLLDELEESGFIMRMSQFGMETKNSVYRLADEYTLFYLKWIEGSRVSSSHEWLTKRSSPAWRSWSGYAFEGICLKHMTNLKRALGIGAVETIESQWHHRTSDPDEFGAQIDLMIDRRDGCINVFEIKYSDGEFAIDKRYAHVLRNKLQALLQVTGTRKTLLLTLMTTHGVRANRYREELVQAELRMSDLFSLPSS